jgi:hypothetical protein
MSLIFLLADISIIFLYFSKSLYINSISFKLVKLFTLGILKSLYANLQSIIMSLKPIFYYDIYILVYNS